MTENMASRDQRRLSSESQGEDSPLLANITNGQGILTGSHGRERGELPMWRHILENKMTWAWYSVVTSTSAISLLIYHLPYQIHRLWVLGAVMYMIALISFLVLLLVHLARFVVRPSMLPVSLTHPNESLYVSTFAVALGMLIINGATYSEKMHTTSGRPLRAFYWIFVAIALVFSIGSPVLQYAKAVPNRDMRNLMPVALQTTFPLVLAGPVAAVIVSHMKTEPHHEAAIAIMAVGTVLQGMGMLVSLLCLASLVERLHATGFPEPKFRPSLFLAAGPPALTSYAAVRLAQQALRHLRGPSGHSGDGGVALYYGGIVTALVFWGLALWFVGVAVAANLSVLGRGRMDIGSQQLQMFNVVFPHAVFALATFELLRVFAYPRALTVVAEIAGIGIVVAYAVVVLGVVAGLVRAPAAGE